MKHLLLFFSGLVLLALPAGTIRLFAQHSSSERFTRHNNAMATRQPSFITPLVGIDPRLVQYTRFSFSHEYTSAGAETVNYGNGRGSGIIVGNRLELDFIEPPYIQHNSAAEDGFGDMAVLAKYRVASANAESGNYDVALILNHCFATGSPQNGAATDSFGPSLAAGYAFHRLDVISSLGGTLPTEKIAKQGRTIAWNTESQVHIKQHLWLEVENNATYFAGGSHDGWMQNFVTPAAFYVIRGKSWKPTRPFFIVDGGMQIATSGFHTYNHNLITEVRVLF
ncbi:MAG TPA: hypothetical protein VGI45_20930 [Terracidiphilus sp.]|jgi:hypothetical protein